MFVSSTKVFVSIAKVSVSSTINAFVSSTINAFIFFLEVGLETLQKRTETRGKELLANFNSSRDGPGKSTETRHQMEERKKTTPHLLCIFSKCRVVFLCSFISCFVAVLFPSPSPLELKFYRNFSLYHIRVELTLQKPLITHEPCVVQLPNLEDRLFHKPSKEIGRSWLQALITKLASTLHTCL